MNDIQDFYETKRLIIRPYRSGDEIAFLEMLTNGNRQYLDELLGSIVQEEDIEKIKKYVQERNKDWKTEKRFVMSYWEKKNKIYLGHIWIEPQDRNLRIYEIGWFIRKKRQGEGLATEAVRKALEFVFSILKASKAVVTVREHGIYKEKSKKLAKRCGFKPEGIIRQSVQIFNSEGPGPIVDVFHYGILRNEAEIEGYI